MATVNTNITYTLNLTEDEITLIGGLLSCVRLGKGDKYREAACNILEALSDVIDTSDMDAFVSIEFSKEDKFGCYQHAKGDYCIEVSEAVEFYDDEDDLLDE